MHRRSVVTFQSHPIQGSDADTVSLVIWNVTAVMNELPFENNKETLIHFYSINSTFPT
jgi:hypothetical protein